ncbi:MAG: MucB/RseB C-terminal domain-containing protein [Gammaproteobacteria bacterium]|nr:MucB/RseB C-terminal domain-containing protein [Gammaproteobacteria bacterium]NND58634.1 hypothetical protein [Gammaproteobacteria bacterium]
MISIVSELCVLAALAGASPVVNDDPQVLLERMAYAVEHLSYEGTFVHIIQDHKAETMRIIHKVEDGHVTERLISLDGSGREIIRNGDEVRCVLEGEKSVVVDSHQQSPLLASLPRQRDGLEDHYRFQLTGAERVANRDTQIIEVRPLDEYRYGHRLWLDQSTGLPLRSALIDNNGDIVEQVLFTSISVDKSISDDELKPSLAAGEGYRWFVEEGGEHEAAAAEAASWQAENLPRGFKLTVASSENGETTTRQHYVYTDGLASVSVFVERVADDAPPMDGLSTIGSANAYATTIDGYQVTAVGEVPPSTVEMIGASLRRRR